MSLNDQTIIITATVAPLKNGKRAVLVSAAPDGELPVILAGNFADLKNLFDEAWLALLKREPVVVPDKARQGEVEKPQAKKTPKPGVVQDKPMTDDEIDQAIAPDDDDADETETVETDTVEPEPVIEPEPANLEPAPDQLVRIENDPTEAQPTLF